MKKGIILCVVGLVAYGFVAFKTNLPHTWPVVLASALYGIGLGITGAMLDKE